MKIHLFGASGTGVTTLGRALSARWGLPYFDTDDYFWEPTPVPFTVRRAPEVRDQLLASHLAPHPSWLLGGSSVIAWGEQWRTAFDLVVFLWLPPALRLARLRAREHARYGDALRTDPDRRRQFTDFMAWAAGYDDGSSGGSRTLANHEAWLASLACPVRQIRGDTTTEERVRLVGEAVQHP
ncbi:MAG: adenylate kinase [Bernardetiaceae bacterium]|jgi:adenylate kinase family enzyme|nr:adenylate kinase [Bernardetiaceae bacterium]